MQLLARRKQLPINQTPRATRRGNSQASGEEQPAQEENKAKIGDSITLTANEEGLEIKVTVMTVQVPARSSRPLPRRARAAALLESS